jgi:protein-S-isoprenylcysteine O-methyltransferase Ste14
MVHFGDIDKDDYNFYIQICFLVLDIPIFLCLLFIKAYYGKFFNKSEDGNCIQKLLRKIFPVIPSRISWIVQECPCVFITIFFIIYYYENLNYKNILVISPFLIHYIHRTFIFPFVIHSSKNNPLEITLMAFTFCFFNAIMINRSIFCLIKDYGDEFLLNYIFGLAIFLLGIYINIHSDYSMIKQRNANQDENNKYIIPRGFMYELISCPNYFGELTEWLGFFILSNSFSGLVFFISTFANLFPRAIQYHQWYKNKFKEEFVTDKDLIQRKAIVPFLF